MTTALQYVALKEKSLDTPGLNLRQMKDSCGMRLCLLIRVGSYAVQNQQLQKYDSFFQSWSNTAHYFKKLRRLFLVPFALKRLFFLQRDGLRCGH